MKTKEKKEINPDDYRSISEYATLCGVSKNTIYTWIKDRLIKTTSLKPYSGKVIDIKKYPPRSASKNGRKTLQEALLLK